MGCIRLTAAACALLAASCASLAGLVGAGDDDDDAPPTPAPEDAGNADVTVDAMPSVDAPSGDAAETTLLRNVTFEDGILVAAGTGANAQSGDVKITTVDALGGSYSAEVQGTSSYFEVAFPPQDDVYVSFSFRLLSEPNNNPRALRFDGQNLSIARAGGNTLRIVHEGADFGGSDPLVVGEVYRIGLHVRAGDGTASAEAYLAKDKTPFGPPFATFSGRTVSTMAKLLVGTSANDGLRAAYDDVRVDRSRMP